MSFLNLMTLRLIPCFFMDLLNVFIFKSEWTYVTDCVDFSSVLHGLQMAEYSTNEKELLNLYKMQKDYLLKNMFI